MFAYNFSNNAASAARNFAVSSSCANLKEVCVYGTACAVPFFVPVIISLFLLADSISYVSLLFVTVIIKSLKYICKSKIVS